MAIEEIRQRNAYYQSIIEKAMENEIKFRCSSLGHIMTEPQKKSETLSKTCKTHLIDVYVSNRYNRFTEINGKALSKGNDTEEDSITTVSLITGKFFKKNTERLKNAFIEGIPDLFEGELIYKADVIRDTKSSWDIYTFHRAKYSELKYLYYWQGQGYMDLTGAKKCFIDYCLNNTPYNLVNKELYYEGFKHDGDTPAWIALQIIANHTYDLKTFDSYIQQAGININENEYSKAVYAGFVEVPLKERYFCFEFDRNDEDIQRMHQRVIECRNFIKTL